MRIGLFSCAFLSALLFCSCNDYSEWYDDVPRINTVTVEHEIGTNELVLGVSGEQFSKLSEAGFVYGYDTELTDGLTVQVATSSKTEMATSVPLTRYGCSFYCQAYFRSGIGQEVRSDIEKFDIPSYDSFVQLSSPTIESTTSSSITVSSSARIASGISITEYGFCYASDKTPTLDDNRLKVTSLREGGTISGLSPSQSLTIAAYSIDSDGNTAYSSPVTATTDVIHVTGVSVNPASLTIIEGNSVTLTAKVSPDDAFDQSVSWSTSNSSVATVDQSGKVIAVKSGTATITVTTADGGKTATCEVKVKSPCPDGAVDLGLSVYWASCNLGASKPEEYGGYYQWAGTQDVTRRSIDLGWDNCPYHTGSSSETGWTKYVPSGKSSYWSGSGSPDNKTVLDPDDDVAHVQLGGNWRMPTIQEFEELRNTSNCTWEWTTLNGVNGYKVTSRKSGYTGNWIFLPAAGFRYDTYFYNVGSYGYYWSSSLHTGYPIYAYELYFSSDCVYAAGYCSNRYDGQSVRPVLE